MEQKYLQDQVDYSTVELTIYQRESIRRTMLANEKKIETYEVGFGSQLADSFSSGLKFLKNGILIIAKLWWLIIIASLAIFFVARIIRKNK